MLIPEAAEKDQPVISPATATTLSVSYHIGLFGCCFILPYLLAILLQPVTRLATPDAWDSSTAHDKCQ